MVAPDLDIASDWADAALMLLVLLVAVVVAVITACLVHGERYRRRMDELRAPDERRPDVASVEGRFSWMRIGN